MSAKQRLYQFTLSPTFVAIALASLGSPTVSEPISRFAQQDAMETVVVTATREQRNKSEMAESVSVLTEVDIDAIAPAHPADILNRVAGVHINNLGGEGHMASIRQPITTAGVYLFLEDGVPTRPTGYFNHNGLYEVNIPQSSRIEVTKGPGSALYGSDAIGGIINSLTRATASELELSANVELGAYGWQRALFSASAPINDATGLRIDVNATESDGYRDESEYQRRSTTLRFDHQLNEQWFSKTIFSYSDIDQSGSSSLEIDEFKADPKKNHFHGEIGFRDVKALRLHSEWSKKIDEQRLLTVTPFFRDNEMRMMPSWMITYDPNVRDYRFQSFGAMLKYRQLFADGKGLWIAGIDVDHTPSTYKEWGTDDPDDVRNGTTDGRLRANSDGIYSDYALTGVRNYDFETDQTSVSPYFHTEWQPNPRWLLSAGLRYDQFAVDYRNRLQGQSQQISNHKRVDSGKQTFEAFSPKLSAIHYFNERHSVYANYRQGFRAPTIGHLYRSGSSEGTEGLQAVEVESVELGFRGVISGNGWQRLQYELAMYELRKTDDIVSVIEGNTRHTVNAGETTHRGIELALDAAINETVSAYLSWTATTQRYDDFAYIYGYFQPGVGFVQEARNHGGNDIARSPRALGNMHIQYRPSFASGLSFEIEYEKVGRYYTDETNELSYGGHELYNLRMHYQLSAAATVYARVMNLKNTDYSTYTSAQVGDSDSSYRPGHPRTAYLGLRYDF